MPPNIPPDGEKDSGSSPELVRGRGHRDIDNDDDDDYDTIPLQHKKPFGAGLYKAPPIAFVPSSENVTNSSTLTENEQHPKKIDLGEWYIQYVSERNTSSATQKTTNTKNPTQAENDQDPSLQKIEIETEYCELCKESFPQANKKAHITSISHQVRIPYTPPPPALDRSRYGVQLLEGQGWDPELRRGLGASQQGIPHPLKPKAKDDRLGIGLKNSSPTTTVKNTKGTTGKKILGAGQMRKLYKEEKRRAANIFRELSGDDKLEKYLGSGSLGQPEGRRLNFDFKKK